MGNKEDNVEARSREFIKHWKEKIIRNKFTDWEDFRNEVEDESIKITLDMLSEIKDVIIKYMFVPVGNALSEIILIQTGIMKKKGEKRNDARNEGILE